MTALLAGATGLIGREVARQWHGRGRLHLLVRKTPAEVGAQHSVHVVDFAALPPLPQAEEAYCCLGTTIKAAGSPAAFRAVDFDAVLSFARACRDAGVKRLGVVSALGADAASANFYSRVKGEMEAAVAAVGFASVVVARPSLLVGDRGSLGQPGRVGEALAIALTRPIAGFIPKAWRPIEAARVACALLRAVAEGRPGMRVLSSAQLQDLAAD
ncbi:MAG: NAD(P)H-binding protein [Rubrivivax sp.]|nr:NAD(P)H-binding protein [Rubrivivax sp.]